MLAFLPMTTTIKPGFCIYLFHGKAVKRMVLAMMSDMQMPNERNFVGILHIRAAAEALHQPHSLQESGESISLPLI